MQGNQKLFEKDDPVIILILRNFTLRKLPTKGVTRIDKLQLLMVILAILRYYEFLGYVLVAGASDLRFRLLA